MSITKSLKELKILHNEKKKEECKGLFFRGTVNIFATAEYVREVRQVKLLKRRSCKGCETCSWMMDEVQEDVNSGSFERYLSNIKDGKIYTIHVSCSQDWESGNWEIDEMEFVEHKE